MLTNIFITGYCVGGDNLRNDWKVDMMRSWVIRTFLKIIVYMSKRYFVPDEILSYYTIICVLVGEPVSMLITMTMPITSLGLQYP
jgi:hypothetical protein